MDSNTTSTFTIDTTQLDWGSISVNQPSTSGYTIGNIHGTAPVITTAGYNGSWIGTSGAYNSSVSSSASGQLTLEGSNADITINGKSLSTFMDTMEKRLAILVPDPAKLEHFTALQKAYNHYKTLEALCELPKENNDE